MNITQTPYDPTSLTAMGDRINELTDLLAKKSDKATTKKYRTEMLGLMEAFNKKANRKAFCLSSIKTSTTTPAPAATQAPAPSSPPRQSALSLF